MNAVQEMESLMFKPLVTLIRGSANRTVDAIVDSNALTILDQQIRESAAVIEGSRRTLALAIAQERQEQTRLQQLKNEIADLETRAMAAVEDGRDDLASEAAEAIATIEDEYEASSRAQEAFAKQGRKLRQGLRVAERRLRDLERGRRVARTNEATRSLSDRGLPITNSQRNALSEAEDTLQRLQSRQTELAEATRALEELDTDETPKTISEKMAAEGFGPPVRSRAEDVLKRLKSDAQTKNTESAVGPKERSEK